MAEEISLAETNKLRAKLGLKLIPPPSIQATPQSQIPQRAPVASSRKRIDSDPPATKKYKVEDIEKTLYEDAGTEEWLRNLGKRTDRQAEQENSPSVHDLDGVVIDHAADELATLSKDDVLTFDDTDVLLEGADRLTNASLSGSRKVKLDLSERARAEEVRLLGVHHRTREFEDTATPSSTVISNAIVTDALQPEVQSHRLDKAVAENLFADDVDSAPTKPKRIKMKSISKKAAKSKPRTTKLADDDIPMAPVQLSNEDDFNDDDELELVLAQRRRLKQMKNRAQLTPEDIAREIAAHQSIEAQDELNRAASANSGIVYDDTTDFLANMSRKVLVTSPSPSTDTDPSANPVLDTPQSVDVGPTDNDSVPTVEFKGLGSTLRFLQEQNVVRKLTPQEQAQARELREVRRKADMLKLQISVEERILQQELSADKNYMNTPKAEREQLFQLYLDQRLQQKGIIAATGPQLGSQSAPIGKLQNYNPQVKLSYKDEEGNEISTKQAYKVLSHKFHGVGPSAGKLAATKSKLSNQGTKNHLIIH